MTSPLEMPGLSRRTCLLALGSMAACASAPGWAATYPSKPIRWVVPYTPGGATDVSVRVIAEYLGQALGQPLVVENKPGAASTIGIRDLASSPADGYTIAIADDATLYNNWHLFKDLPYNVDSFDYVAMTGRSPLMLVVHESLQAATFAEFVEYAHRNVGKLNYGTPGIGTPHHIGMATLNDRFKLSMQAIHYKGTVPAMNDALSGVVQVLFVASAIAHQYEGDKRIRFLAVTPPERMKDFPDVPTLKEVGFDSFDITAEQGILMRNGSPAGVVERLNREVNTILANPVVQARLEKVGIVATIRSPAEFKEHVVQRAALAGEIIRSQNIRIGAD